MGIRITTIVRIVTATAAFLTVVRGARTRETYAEKRDTVEDLESSASGFIYRKDGQNPPIFIKLGEGHSDKFDAILEGKRNDAN
jgi:hypothetical protein